MRVDKQSVPELRTPVITAVKDAALAVAPWNIRKRAQSMKDAAGRYRGYYGRSGSFYQPGGYVGPAELASLQEKYSQRAPLQVAAIDKLLHVSGSWVDS